jgi:3-isopropylmalate/(R)-2-methylmalate dehydratase small subunit
MMHIKTKAVLLPIENIDTDQIIPAKFLKSIEKTGFGAHLFANWRFDENNEEIPSFALNNSKGEVLIAVNNFGCGSSREHAAWALADYGFKAIISSQFADIFKGNALNNGIIPIEVSVEQLKEINRQLSNSPETMIGISLNKQEVNIDGLEPFTFEIDGLKKLFILEGKEELDYILGFKEEIVAFANK